MDILQLYLREYPYVRGRKGKMPERSNGHAWKVCVPPKGTEGSNPSLSATKALAHASAFFISATACISAR